MYLLRKILIPVTYLLIISGCSNSNNDANDEVTEKVSQEEVSVEEAALKSEEPKRNKRIDLIEIVSLDKEGIIELLGQPQNSYESEYGNGLDYDGLSITLDDSQKFKSMEISSTDYLLKGIMLGHKPDDVRKELGKSTKEGVPESGEGFELVYDTVINENQTNTLYFASGSFNSPIDYMSYSKTDTTPLFTTEEVKEVIIGSWVREDDMMNGDYSDLVYFTETKMITDSFNGTISGLVRLYNIINYNTIELTGINSYSDYENEKFKTYTLEISSDGESITIYRTDSYTGEIFENSVISLYKYSDSIVTQ